MLKVLNDLATGNPGKCQVSLNGDQAKFLIPFAKGNKSVAEKLAGSPSLVTGEDLAALIKIAAKASEAPSEPK